MKRKVILLFVFSIFFLTNCKKEDITNGHFEPTNHVISTMGDSMRFSIILPTHSAFYSFSAVQNDLNCEGDNCNEYLVQSLEMNKLASNLSDTLQFEWEPMTAWSPYPPDNCVFLIYSGMVSLSYEGYMCSIGKGDSAANIIENLSISLSGKSQSAFIDINNYLLEN